MMIGVETSDSGARRQFACGVVPEPTGVSVSILSKERVRIASSLASSLSDYLNSIGPVGESG
jgi:hypothetical protein